MSNHCNHKFPTTMHNIYNILFLKLWRADSQIQLIKNKITPRKYIYIYIHKELENKAFAKSNLGDRDGGNCSRSTVGSRSWWDEGVLCLAPAAIWPPAGDWDVFRSAPGRRGWEEGSRGRGPWERRSTAMGPTRELALESRLLTFELGWVGRVGFGGFIFFLFFIFRTP